MEQNFAESKKSYNEEEIMKGVMDGIVDEEEIKIDNSSTDDEKQKAAEKIVDRNLKYNIEKIIYDYIYYDINIMDYMAIKYKNSGKYRSSGKLKDFYDIVSEPEEYRIGSMEKRLKKSTLKYFPFVIKEIKEKKEIEITEFCKKSQEILFTQENFDIFDLEKECKGSEDITRYGFFKTKNMIDEIEKEEEEEEKKKEEIRIQNLLFMDYVLGIRLTNLIYLGTEKIEDMKTLKKILNIIEILAKIPCLKIRIELAIEIMCYIRKQEIPRFGNVYYWCYDEEYIKDNLENKKWKPLNGRPLGDDDIVKEVIDNRVEKAERILKKLSDNLKEWCSKRIQVEMNLILNEGDENELEKFKNNIKQEAILYIKDEFKSSMWNTYVEFHRRKGGEELIGKENEISDRKVFEWGEKMNRDNLLRSLIFREFDKHFLIYIYTVYRKKPKATGGEKIKKTKIYKKKRAKDTIKNLIKKEQSIVRQIKIYIAEQRENIKRIEDSYKNMETFFTGRIKETRRDLNDLQKYASIHKYVVRGINQDFKKIR